MPKKRPIVAQKVLLDRSARSDRRRRLPLWRWSSASGAITETVTTEKDMTDWVGWFARFHADPTGLHVPYALRSLDCAVQVDQQQPTTQRCVREVAKFNGVRGVEWKLITWLPGVPGVQVASCRSLAEAMDGLDASPELILLRPATALPADSA